MDCCGSSKPKEKDEYIKGSHVDQNTLTEKANGKDVKTCPSGHENSPTEKGQAHGGGCCGGGTKDMVLHIVLMIVVFLIISFFLKRG